MSESWQFVPKSADEIELVAEHRIYWWKRGESVRRTKTPKRKGFSEGKVITKVIKRDERKDDRPIGKQPDGSGTPRSESNDVFPYKGIFGE